MKDEKVTKKIAKEIVEKGKWLLLVGGSTNEREEYARLAHNESEIYKGYGEIESIDLAGQTGKEILTSVLAATLFAFPEENLEDSLNKLREYGLWEYRETSEKLEWKLLEADKGITRVSKDDYDRIKAIKTIQRLVEESPIFNLFLQFKTLFINNLQCKNEQDVNAVKKITVFIRQNIKYFRGMLIVGVETKKDYNRLPKDFLQQFEIIDLKTGSGTKGINQTTKSKNVKGAKEKDSFADVELKMIVDWKGNYGNSHYQVSVTCNSPLNDEFELDFRFMPSLYLLVKGVKKGTLCVPNKELKNAYKYPDEAKKEIKNAFTNVIGKRAKKIIKIKTGIGKELMVPKKNITLQINESTFKDKI